MADTIGRTWISFLKSGLIVRLGVTVGVGLIMGITDGFATALGLAVIEAMGVIGVLTGLGVNKT